ncbi:unnamed protein product [Rhizophagus irregularis]|nr:unnamed protein product [Rhizophagus irregularis]
MLFNSNKFTNLKAPLLKLLLKRDDLSLEEIIIWDNLLKWGLAQNPSISQDSTKWSKEDIIIMERSLHGFVPLVRFYHISSDDFIEKVYPLKKLLPENLVDDLIKFHITPNKKLSNDNVGLSRQSKFIYDSTLIERQHFAVLASWIDKKENLHLINIPYKFNLLYRASRDGNTPAAFHAKCDNKGATIVVAKIKNSEQIVGGYNPLYWNSIVHELSTFDSFIYFFADVKNIVTAKVSYSNGNAFSIGNNPNYAPIFGGGYDLYHHGYGVWYSNNYENTSSYPKIDGIPSEVGYNRINSVKFNVNDYEVFQVIRK